MPQQQSLLPPRLGGPETQRLVVASKGALKQCSPTMTMTMPPTMATTKTTTTTTMMPVASCAGPVDKGNGDRSRHLQNAYDTYAENIHAISIRASSHAAIGNYGSALSSSSLLGPCSGTSNGDKTHRHHHNGDQHHQHHHQQQQHPHHQPAAAHRRRRSEDGGRRLSMWQTSFHLISFMAGSGLVFLPLALVEINWYGLLLLVVAGIICVYTSQLLIEAMDILRWSSGRTIGYSDLSRACFGALGGRVTDGLMHLGFLISATGYVALASSCLAGVMGVRFGTVLVLIGSATWLHVFVQSLAALALLSAVNVGLSFWIEAVIFGDAMYPLKQIALEDSAFVFETPDLSGSSLFLKLAYSFTLLASGFYCHAVIPMFANAMVDHRQCRTVVTRSQVGVMGLLYLPICGITYAVYGATLQAPVFFNMRNAVVRNLAIVLYCIHLLLSYTITLRPLQEALEGWLLTRATMAHATGDRAPAAHSASSSSSTSSSASYRRVPSMANGRRSTSSSITTTTPLMNDDSPPSSRLGRRRAWGVRVLGRSATVLATLALAYAFEPTTLGMFGAMIVPVVTLSMVLPCVFFWRLCSEEAGYLDRAAIVAIVSLSLVSAVSSLYVVIRDSGGIGIRD